MPNGRGRSGKGQGGGSGQGAGRGAGQGSGGGPAGVTKCVCPGCGHEEPHQRGVPCAEKKCPECRTTMIGKR